MHDRLSYRCPHCGHQTLVIDRSGWIICSWLPCRNPAAFHDRVQKAMSDERDPLRPGSESWHYPAEEARTDKPFTPEHRDVQPVPWRPTRTVNGSLWSLTDANDVTIATGFTQSEASLICSLVNWALVARK